MYDPKQLQAVVQSAAPDMELLFRPMFGGIMGYARGKPFASFSDMGLGLKLSGADHAELLRLPGARALQYAADQPVSKSYVVVPKTMLSQPDVLRGWIERCVRNLPAAKPKKRK